MKISEWIFLGALAAVSAAMVLTLHRKTERQRAALLHFRDDTRLIAKLEIEKKELLAIQTPAEELAQLRHDHEELARLKSALVKLRSTRVYEEVMSRHSSNTKSTTTIREAAPFSQDAGSRSPRATLESVIWAANSGNVEALAPLIAFTPTGRAEAETLFKRLPTDVQAEYGSPEKIYATLLAANLPLKLKSAATLSESAEDSDHATLAMRLERRAGQFHDVQFSFQRSEGGWKLIVPDHIVGSYARVLTGFRGSVTKS